MNIRKYKDSDLNTILDIYSKSKLDELVFEKSKFKLCPLNKDKERYDKFMKSDVYVFEKEYILGYGSVLGAEITALFVHPSSRGQQIGNQLLEYLLSRIEGVPFLYVAKSNVLAKKLYSKYGFSTVDEFQTSYNGVPVYANKMQRNME